MMGSDKYFEVRMASHWCINWKARGLRCNPGVLLSNNERVLFYSYQFLRCMGSLNISFELTYRNILLYWFAVIYVRALHAKRSQRSFLDQQQKRTFCFDDSRPTCLQEFVRSGCDLRLEIYEVCSERRNVQTAWFKIEKNSFPRQFRDNSTGHLLRQTQT